MEKDFLADFASAIAQIAEEKGIERGRVMEVVEAALAAAYKKEYGKRGQHIRAEFDDVSGSVKFFLQKEVVDETVREFPTVVGEGLQMASLSSGEVSISTAGADLPSVPAQRPRFEDSDDFDDGDEDRLQRFHCERDIIVEDAQEFKKGAVVGDTIEIELPPHSDFGRVAAQTAKQVIIQRVREAERDAMFAEYKEKEGEVLNGTVQRVEGRTVFVDLGKSVGALLPPEQIPGENYRVGQRVKVLLASVASDSRGPGIVLSRTHPDFVRRLFELEVPEIFSGTVQVKSIAREAGSRTKIAVFSEEQGVDPIGSCVGQKGTRVQAVIDELGGEKIDIIEWRENVEKFIGAALSPAKVASVTLNEEEKHASVLVPEDQLSLAIGRRGQNVRLASRLVGWRIDVSASTAEDAVEESSEEGVEADASESGEVSALSEEEKADENVISEKVVEVDAPALDDDVVSALSDSDAVVSKDNFADEEKVADDSVEKEVADGKKKSSPAKAVEESE
ncbi:MAG: transcription termination/antitermination protein NusA [Candidatus Moranbacteria bacterium]|nr:transcription termination/antitermination protein NusA [Candidatus Moranbacteria bacterium]